MYSIELLIDDEYDEKVCLYALDLRVFCPGLFATRCEVALKPADIGQDSARHLDAHEKGMAHILSYFTEDFRLE